MVRCLGGSKYVSRLDAAYGAAQLGSRGGSFDPGMRQLLKRGRGGRGGHCTLHEGGTPFESTSGGRVSGDCVRAGAGAWRPWLPYLYHAAQLPDPHTAA